MKVKFITESISSAMGKGKRGYRGKIVDRSTRSFDDIVAAVAKTYGLRKELVKSIVTGFFEEAVEGACENGEIQHIGGYGSLALNLCGRFEGVDDTFDPARHRLEFSFTPDRRLKRRKVRFELENKVPRRQVVIESACGNGPAVNYGVWFMLWGKDVLCNGKNVKMVPGDSVAWACTLPDGTERSGPCDVFKNTDTTVDFRWPEDIPTEAVGRDIALTFRLRGGKVENAPVEIVRNVRLYAA